VSGKRKKNTRTATVLASLYVMISAGGLTFVYLNWSSSGHPGLAGMANGIMVSCGAAVMFALALALFIVFFFATAGIRHYLTIIGMLCIWLAVLAPFFESKPRVDYAVKVENNSTRTVTVDTLSTFGQPLTTDDFWTLRSGDAREYGSLSSTHFPSSVTIIWWYGRDKPTDGASIFQTSVICPAGLQDVGTLVFTLDKTEEWTVSVHNLNMIGTPKLR
jgi:hypothetical protein